jgi:hypothetical protein
VDWRSAETLTIGQEARPQACMSHLLVSSPIDFTSFAAHTPSRGAITSQTPPPLPLEVKTLIAEQAGRGTLVNFCATSREEYLNMMPILYGRIVQHVRTFGRDDSDLRRLTLLLFTLGSTEWRRRNLGPYPATLVRELHIFTVVSPSWLEGALQKALRCTADYAPYGRSQLRAFHWDADEIAIFHLLSERPAFENLAELSVAQSCSNTSEFEVRPNKALRCVINSPFGSSFFRFRGSDLSYTKRELCSRAVCRSCGILSLNLTCSCRGAEKEWPFFEILRASPDHIPGTHRSQGGYMVDGHSPSLVGRSS